MAQQNVDDKVRRINGMLEDAIYPFRLESRTEDSILKVFFLSWPGHEATQTLQEVYLVSNAHAFLDGLYHGIEIGMAGDAFDFPPAPTCSLCHGQGYCQCQVDMSGRDWNEHPPKGKAERTIEALVAVLETDGLAPPEYGEQMVDALIDAGYLPQPIGRSWRLGGEVPE